MSSRLSVSLCTLSVILLLVTQTFATDPPKRVPLEGKATLTKEPTRDSFGFTTASYGKIEKRGKVYNVNSQITFDWYKQNHISVSVQGGERSAIRLVEPRTTKVKKLFEGIALKKGRIVVPGGTPFEIPAPDRKTKHAAPTAGQIYVIRIDGVATGNQRVKRGGTAYVKIQILDFVPDSHVTFRWKLL